MPLVWSLRSPARLSTHGCRKDTLRLLLAVHFSMNTAISSSNNISMAWNKVRLSALILPLVGAQPFEFALQGVELLAQGGLVEAGHRLSV